MTLTQISGKTFPLSECNHREFCTNSRRRSGYRSRTYRCDKCGAKRSTIEIEVPSPGSGDTYEGWRVKLMKLLSGRQCKALVEFMEEPCSSSKV